MEKALQSTTNALAAIILQIEKMLSLLNEGKHHGRKLTEDEIVKCPNANKGCTKTFLTMENHKRHVRLICQKQADIK